MKEGGREGNVRAVGLGVVLLVGEICGSSFDKKSSQVKSSCVVLCLDLVRVNWNHQFWRASCCSVLCNFLHGLYAI